jgi:hypothetical protein
MTTQMRLLRFIALTASLGVTASCSSSSTGSDGGSDVRTGKDASSNLPDGAVGGKLLGGVPAACSGDVCLAVSASDCPFITCSGTVYALCIGGRYTACDCTIPPGYTELTLMPKP